MPVIVKYIITRSSLHDLYWFELPAADKVNIHIQDFANYANEIKINLQLANVSNWNIILNMKDQLRPDIRSMIDDGIITSSNDLMYNPTMLMHEFPYLFENIEKCREANQKLFDLINPTLVKLAKQSNNKIRDEIYDEDGNFLEYGLFNIE